MRLAIAEAFALRRTMKLCAELGMSIMILEGDAQVIAKESTSDEESCIKYKVLIENARSILRERIS